MKKSAYATEAGAISGALPPLIGWSCSCRISVYGWILFGILFTWQLPHFMAIAWNFRKDYQTGGFKLHKLGNPDGFHLAEKSLIYSILLTVFVFSPFFVNSNQPTPGNLYLVSSILLSFYLLKPAYNFLFSSDRDHSARKLFFVTIFITLALYIYCD